LTLFITHTNIGNVHLARFEPKKFLSIQFDGTDQFPLGRPSFAEIFKKDKTLRMMHHELVGVIDHGPERQVIVYDAMEHVPHNPNMVIDGVQRTLKYLELQNNGVLPDILFLQFDNCLRENKNAYVCSYLANLIERGVFKCIYMSFLPVGHTHDICDQVNSRLSVACKHQDILLRDTLCDLMAGAYDPTPTVVKMDAIADWKLLVNPEAEPHFAGSRSLIHEHSGILNPLLFKFGKNRAGRAGFQTKLTVDDENWSTFFYPFRNHPSGVDLGNIPGNDAYEIGEERMAQVEDHVRASEWRASMTEEVMVSLMDDIKLIGNPPMEFNWLDGGKFAKENKEEYPQLLEEHENDLQIEEEEKALLRPTHIFTSHYQKNKYEQQYLRVGLFVAVDVTDRHQSESDVQRFFTGQVTSVDNATQSCQVRWWNSTTGEFGAYKKYSGPGEQSATVAYIDILVVFRSFTAQRNQLRSKERKAIETQLSLPKDQRLPIIPPN